MPPNIKKGWDATKKLGSFFNIFTSTDTDRLKEDARMGEILTDLVQSQPYQQGLKVVLDKRREQILTEIKTVGNPADYQRLAGRLQEIDGVSRTIIDIMNKGNQAIQQLNKIKETENV